MSAPGKKSAALRTQMTLFVLAGVFLSCFLVAVMAGENTRRALVDQAERYTATMMRQVIRNLEYYLDDMESLAALSNVQASVLRLLVNDAPIETNQSRYFENALDVRAVLTDFSMLRPEITSITIVGKNGAMADTSFSLYSVDQVSEAQLAWYQTAFSGDGKPVFLPPHVETDPHGRSMSVISLTRPIAISRGAPPIGAICINLSTATIDRICEDAMAGQDSYFYIIDENGNSIYSPTLPYPPDGALPSEETVGRVLSRALAGEPTFLMDGQMVLTSVIESADYRVCAMLPYQRIVESANQARVLHLALGAVSAVLMAILIAWLLARQVFRPLYALGRLMAHVQKGNFNVHADDTKQNEIGELAAGFNTMTEHSLALMDKNIQIEKQKRKAELDALQAQITPHFLYNTLDSIVWMSEYKPDVAARMADALAKLFRLMLGGGADVVPLEQELEHVRQYLTIQSMRYSSKLNYEITADPDLNHIRVPKLLLQPLVENAIYHGIKRAGKMCMLRVHAMADLDELVLLVMDDGAGISRSELDSILSGNRKPDPSLGGIGVKNINERIRMYCPGGDFGLIFLSEENLGTAVIVRLPLSGVG